MITKALQMALAAVALLNAGQMEARAEQRVSLRETCFAEQREFWDCEAQLKAMLVARRGGKSSTAVPWVIEGAIDNPGTVNPYISITRQHAKLNFWALAKAKAMESGVPYRTNEAELTIAFESGGIFVLGGADKLPELEKYRGLKIARAFVDECGTMPSAALVYLIEEVLEPATMDVAGQVGLGGTPGRVKAGKWFDLTRIDKPQIPVFRWTAKDNPHIEHATVWLTDLRKRRGWTEKTPKYRREYLGEWCEDPGELVFPVDEGINFVDELPTANEHGLVLDRTRWRYAIGSDIGASPGLTTLNVTASHPDLVCDYIVWAEGKAEWLVSDWVERVVMMRRGTDVLPPMFPNAALVVDAGGMGKYHTVELQKRYREPFVAAEKAAKPSQIEITRDRLVSGRLKILRGPQTEDLVREWQVLGWAEDEHGQRKTDKHGTPYPDPTAQQHHSDGTLYSLRHQWNYRAEESRPSPEPGTPAFDRAEQARMVSNIKRARDRKRKRQPWMG